MPRHPENTHHPQGLGRLVDMGLVIEFPARLPTSREWPTT